MTGFQDVSPATALVPNCMDTFHYEDNELQFRRRRIEGQALDIPDEFHRTISETSLSADIYIVVICRRVIRGLQTEGF